MIMKAVSECLYKHDGEYSILYDNILEINDSFNLLLNIKEAKSKEEVIRTMLDITKRSSKVTNEEEIGLTKLMDSLVNIIYKDIQECHKKIYG